MIFQYMIFHDLLMLGIKTIRVNFHKTGSVSKRSRY